MLVGTIVMLVLLSVSLAAFASVLTDPIQRRLGAPPTAPEPHAGRFGANLRGPTWESLTVKDHYVARLLNLLDYAAAASRILRSG